MKQSLDQANNLGVRAQERLNAVLRKKKELDEILYVEKLKLEKCINDQVLLEVERDNLKLKVAQFEKAMSDEGNDGLTALRRLRSRKSRK
ncbi:hypothetical protein CDL15_Pgr018407 [Punica granatum]|uniref:Uncharacterized protein n=1 Tax=Punica granatum TaxID=22663 RepID=A0A218W375_PUNGR|nr:hypothetical protein CDL15_Pgr018407 [Punica granatum]